MDNKRVLYFAYGSNILIERIYNRVGKVKVIGVYTVKGYTLSFNCGYPPRQCYANMIKSEGSSIEGVLYELTESQIAELDKYECYPKNYNRIYFYDNVKDAIIFAYVATPWFTLAAHEKGKPNLEYLNILIKGCAEFKIANTLHRLRTYKGLNYKLRVNRFNEEEEDIPYKKGKTSFKVRNGKVIAV